MNKKELNETEICQSFITPAIVAAGWDKLTQVRPSYGHLAHPLEVIDGKPTGAASLALAFGEAVFGGGCDPEEWSDHEARCASCGQDLDPERR